MPLVVDFFTTWVFALLAAHRFVAPYVDLVYLSFIAMIIGSYVTMVKRHTYVYSVYPGGPSHAMTGWRKFWLVDVLHVAAFAFALAYCRQKTTACSMTNAAAIMILYGASHDSMEVYGTSMKELALVFIASTVTYLATLARR